MLAKWPICCIYIYITNLVQWLSLESRCFSNISLFCTCKQNFHPQCTELKPKDMRYTNIKMSLQWCIDIEFNETKPLFVDSILSLSCFECIQGNICPFYFCLDLQGTNFKLDKIFVLVYLNIMQLCLGKFKTYSVIIRMQGQAKITRVENNSVYSN